MRRIRRGDALHCANRQNVAEAQHSRMAIRLSSGLPLDVLAELAAEALCQCPKLLQRAESLLSSHAPPESQHVANSVILSADLLPALMATLTLFDFHAAAVCDAWRQAWQATAEGRRSLQPKPTGSGALASAHIAALAPLPGGEAIYASIRLPDSAHFKLEVVDKQLRTVPQQISGVEGLGNLLAGEHGFYVRGPGSGLAPLVDCAVPGHTIT